MASKSYDFIIVGSGVSGGRVAWELVKSGAKCLMLEAGREFSASTFPTNEMDSSTQLFWGGGLEVSADGHLGFLRARCVGGTSVVNQALLDRFDDDAWDDWRRRSGVSDFTAREFEPHYKACEMELSISQIPKQHWNRNAHLFIGAFEKKGYGWKPLDRAQGDCALDQGSDCIVCLGGCPRNSKQSSLVTTVHYARVRGMELLSEFQVERVVHSKDGVAVSGTHHGEIKTFSAPKVVLAAGSLGNVKILQQSGFSEKLPALGTRFTCHPQFMTYAYFHEEINAHKGAFQAVKSEDAKLRKAGFKLENVFAGPIGTAMLFPGTGAQHIRRMAKYRHFASMEVALRDEPAGKIRVDKKGKLIIEKSLTAEDHRKGQAGLKLVRELFEAADAQEIIPCEQAFGLHLMGGCPMGTDGGTAAVTPDFRLHGHRNLILADSSVFPAAPGINPSFTIMALSHRAAQKAIT